MYQFLFPDSDSKGDKDGRRESSALARRRRRNERRSTGIVSYDNKDVSLTQTTVFGFTCSFNYRILSDKRRLNELIELV